MDRLTAHLIGMLPWWVASSLAERMVFTKQDVLNKHGLKPEHKFLQQHLIVTGLCDDEHTLHDELERGHITVRKGIQEFTEDGIIFTGETEVQSHLHMLCSGSFGSVLDPASAHTLTGDVHR